ncbi:MAG: mechanosensitive ion channel family protein, partial [Ignavibacteria bacterium]|nr:mechanosensitive ion channel family protein [Ignavibacteria bacterium]
TTNIKTMDGQYVFIPNSMIINNPLSNYTFESKRRFDFTIQFDYTNDIDKAKIVIYNSLQKINEVITDPKPLVIVDQLTTSTSVKIYYWLDTHVVERNIMEIKSEVIEVSRKDLNDAGIFITDVTQVKIMNENISFEINSKLN